MTRSGDRKPRGAGLLQGITRPARRAQRDRGGARPRSTGGGTSLLIPVMLDDYLLDGWSPADHPGLPATVRARVAADFRKDVAFDHQMVRLVEALKKVRPAK